MTADVDAAHAEVVLQAGVHPFHGAALLEALRLMRCEVDLGAAARVVIDQRHMAQAFAVGTNHRAAVRGIHQVIAVGDALRTDGRQRYRDLRIVHAGGGQHGRDRDHAVGDFQVQLIAQPARREALAIALAADIAALRQIGQHRFDAHAKRLTLQTRAGLGLTHLILAGPVALARGRLGHRCGLGRRLARLNGGGIARHMADQRIAQLAANRRFMHPP